MYIFQFLLCSSRPICSLSNKNLNAASQLHVVLLILTITMFKEIHVLIYLPWNRWLLNDIYFSHCGRSFVKYTVLKLKETQVVRLITMLKILQKSKLLYDWWEVNSVPAHWGLSSIFINFLNKLVLDNDINYRFDITIKWYVMTKISVTFWPSCIKK